MMNERKYVSDMIGDQYKEWKKGNFYFLTAGTGTGKSTFITKQLLDYAIQENKKILYLVNRKILKNQLEHEIEKAHVFDPVSKHINVQTYQECEKSIKDNCAKYCQHANQNQIMAIMKQNLGIQSLNTSFPGECGTFYFMAGWLKQYSYIICDEAHYFSHDSVFNTNTSIIYEAILGRALDIKLDGSFDKGLVDSRAVCVFMSATLGDLMKYVERDIGRIYGSTQGNSVEVIKTSICAAVSTPTDYSYVNVHMINSVEEVPKTVVDKKGKWFVAINDKVKGKKIVRDINKLFGDLDDEGTEEEVTNSEGKKRKAVFIDADYYDEEEERKEKDKIKYENRFECDVLVSTSVLDNGAGIRDKETRQVIILAGMEDDFIQMLGRIRVDKDDKIDLYICPGNINDFGIRLNNYVRPHLDCYKKVRCLTQNDLADRLLNPKSNQYLCHFIYSCIGLFYINGFSIDRFRYMEALYEEIISELNKDRYAFLKRQFKWLGKSEEEIQKCLDEYELKTLPKLIEAVEERILGFVDKPLNEEDRKNLRDTLYGKRGDFHELHEIRMNFGEKLDDNIWKQIAKNDSALSKPSFDKLCKAYDLPFHMEYENANETQIKGKGKIFVIQMNNN